ncbi:MAG: diguanylate cyclase [Bryobacteraceae bacterium]|nr:diguanylate cyclase [Bryobacteraceae bacterium]
MRILIADDSIVSRHLLEATLRKWGYEVIVACDGAEAWEILQRDSAPAIAILDWVMPCLTGPEVCRKVRHQQGQEPYTYLLLLTSKNMKEDLIEGMDSGADDYITKPFDQHELQVRLRAGTRIVKLQQELRRQAAHDPLTGVLSRSKAFEMFDRELQRSLRESLPLSVLLVDLDHFKSVNDTYGHLAGDEVLREAARRLKEAVRSYDILSRYGGEEFLILMPGCDEESARTQAERLRQAMAESPVIITSANGAAHPLTASIGVTISSPLALESPESLVRVADEALYAAKRTGRNRVVFRATDDIAASVLSEPVSA